ncbi:hypothetical protein ACIPY0_12195 [Paenarthrobacter nicotinovorans]|uniref:hypothetical protein n=1 Tax=Paenarthrobacter nicotinovorans TaxID=29320 RepID=UPI0037FA1CD0
MTSFDHTLEAIPSGSTNRYYGTAYHNGSRWLAEVRGKLLDVWWADPIQLVQGGQIAVDVTKLEGRGQYSALVVAAYTDQPRPITGTVMVVGVDEIVVAGDDSSSYATRWFVGPITDYAVADPVKLAWSAGSPTIIGKLATISVPPPAPPPPPPAVVATGTEYLTATATDTWGVGGWGRWSTSKNGGEDVYSGTWAGITVTGAVFFGAPRPALQGKTITGIRVRVPQRIREAGASGPSTIHLYAHTSSAKPGTDVTRVAGPFDISVADNQSPSIVTIPPGHASFAGFAAALQAGGGLSIAGDPYTGWHGRLDDPQAWQAELDWSA